MVKYLNFYLKPPQPLQSPLYHYPPFKELTRPTNLSHKHFKHSSLFGIGIIVIIVMCRLGPHTVITFVFLEQMNKSYMRVVHGVEGGPAGL